MKKITSFVILAILILTCVFAFVACGDKADPNDAILGWYIGNKYESSRGPILFSIKDGKLVYSYRDGDTFTVVKKNKDGQYVVGGITYTLDTTHSEKWISNRNDFESGNGLYKYVASADKTFNEVSEILESGGNPWDK